MWRRDNKDQVKKRNTDLAIRTYRASAALAEPIGRDGQLKIVHAARTASIWGYAALLTRPDDSLLGLNQPTAAPTSRLMIHNDVEEYARSTVGASMSFEPTSEPPFHFTLVLIRAPIPLWLLQAKRQS